MLYGINSKGLVEVRFTANRNRFKDRICITSTGREIVEPIYNKVFKGKLPAINAVAEHILADEKETAIQEQGASLTMVQVSNNNFCLYEQHL